MFTRFLITLREVSLCAGLVMTLVSVFLSVPVLLGLFVSTSPYLILPATIVWGTILLAISLTLLGR